MPLAGAALGPPAAVSVGSLTFGNQLAGTASAIQTVTLSNTGTEVLSIGSLSILGPNLYDFTETDNCGSVVAPGASCLISISFTPTAAGPRFAVLWITSNSVNSPQSVLLNGTGIGVPDHTFITAGLTFENQSLESSSRVQQVSFWNPGTTEVEIASITIAGANVADFTQTNTCGSTLAPGAVCTISVTFTPGSVGLRTSSLIVSSNVAGSREIVPLSGTGEVQINLAGGKPDTVHVIGDFDGDGRLDYAVWRESNGTWYLIPSSHPSVPIVQQWGLPGDIPVPGDYDGDGKTDFAVWRPSNGKWYVIPSSHPAVPIVQQWGLPGDIPVPGDFDGDRKTDFAVWRPSIGTWYVIPSSHPAVPIVQQWGLPGDIPVPGDFDGSGKTEMAIWRTSTGTWYVIPANYPTSPIVRQWGLPGDMPIPGDFDGDGKVDFAVWRPSIGVWYIIPSSRPAAPLIKQWGLPGDVPIAGDFDGDGKANLGVWRPTTGLWYTIPSRNPGDPIVQQWGLNGDTPL